MVDRKEAVYLNIQFKKGVLEMCVLSLLPVIIIFMLLQKYIVEGVASTGIKG